jgi:hypothetical protein
MTRPLKLVVIRPGPALHVFRDGREVEFADCIIRILDTCAALGLDVAGAVIEKNRYNRQRADHKLAARAAGGKKY